LVHHWLYAWAGAERVLEQFAAMLPQADVLAGFVTPEMRQAHPVAARAVESWVGGVPGARRHHRWFLPLHAAAFASYDTSRYDLIISISHAFEKMVRPRRGQTVHLSYCLSPPRYLWDLSESHDRLATPIQRFALRLGRTPARAVDRWAARGVHRFVSLSRAVAARVERAYGRKSTVVYPPVAAKPGVKDRGPREDYLLTIGRLVPYKRVDLAIDAAARLGLRLVIAGDGPERARLQRLGKHAEFLGAVSDEEAGRLLSRCRAFVFCAEEDFGIAPVEANAHGAPVVAYARGGAAETMVAGTTAVLFHEQAADAVANAIEQCLSTSWNSAALRQNAERFAPESFRTGMTAEIHKCLTQSGPR
jgi:glycosyltransferase involved in cell wall biosynthesis